MSWEIVNVSMEKCEPMRPSREWTKAVAFVLLVVLFVCCDCVIGHAQTVVTGAWPTKVAEIHLTGKTAAITFTTIPGAVAGGVYRVSAVARMTTVATAGTLIISVGANNWNTSAAGNNAGMTNAQVSSAVVTVFKPTGVSTPLLQYKVDNTGATGSYTYDVDILVERIF